MLLISGREIDAVRVIRKLLDHSVLLPHMPGSKRRTLNVESLSHPDKYLTGTQVTIKLGTAIIGTVAGLQTTRGMVGELVSTNIANLAGQINKITVRVFGEELTRL